MESSVRRLEEKKETVYARIRRDDYRPMKLKELAILMGIPKEQKEERKELREILEELTEEGKIRVDKRGRYKAAEKTKVRGIYRASSKGYGFVEAEGEKDDIYIPADQKNGAFEGDEVDVLLLDPAGAPTSGKSREGRILKIRKRGTTRIVGTYEEKRHAKKGLVRPDDDRLLTEVVIPSGKTLGAADGDKIVVKLTSYGEDGKKPSGKIKEVFGHAGDPGVDVLSVVKAYDLPTEFSREALEEGEQKNKPISAEEKKGRRDLRETLTVTIDGEDAKDLDDAVSLTKEGENYKLGVHIADVSHYVKEGSALDKQALMRGTSVYLADRVIPMLPTALSNGICSLNAGEERLTLSCLMTVDPRGIVVDHEIVPTLIKVDQRLSYNSVQKILEAQDEEEIKKYESLVPQLTLMQELSEVIRARRQKRGAIDFNLPESEILLDASGNPVDVRPAPRNTATRMIEDFMLLANETVAQDAYWRELPFLYRTHEPPTKEEARELTNLLHYFGYSMHVGDETLYPGEIQKLLKEAEGAPEETLIRQLALRTMKQARYTPENLGHFGIAANYYTHFTSPIRRYPDLIVHRILKENLAGTMDEARICHYEEILPEVAQETSQAERRAEAAERETEKLEKARFMQGHVGETYAGIISGITRWGLYVELPNTVEGLVHVANMTDDHYDYIEDSYEMVGMHTGKTYTLGQPVSICVLGADPKMRTIDFVLTGEEEK